ncbi:cytochrome c oxidase subunit 5C isoform X1 [Elaeis guineensis]|uniref:Cytochrome c oxidase subunit 5C isoform X1 n=2 Tax=Elaeis guineensis var. tenera TaxID=51953 RepID=A0A6I9R8D7_ELAGV|nr:cytochrome c oxidase subunit 5C isoform X1 [Elaeis guineensis]
MSTTRRLLSRTRTFFGCVEGKGIVFFPAPSRVSDFAACGIPAEMAAHKIAHATLRGPSVVKEICIGITLGLFAGSLWKMHHWNEQRKTRAFYDMLEKGEISVVVEE